MRKIIIVMGIITLMLAILNGCDSMAFGPGMLDYSYAVGTGYKLVRSSGHEIDVTPIGGISDDDPKPFIRAKVVEIAWDERYVLAKRLALKPDPKHPNSGYEIPDKTKVFYYILDTLYPLDNDTIKPKLYAPFDDFNEFSKKRKELGISDELVLKDVSKYPRQSLEEINALVP